jgi:hypothetical protein
VKRQLAALIIGLTYSVSFFLPAASIGDLAGNDKPVLGYDALLLGWSAFGVIPEFANVALLIGLIAYIKRFLGIAAASGWVAFALGLTAPGIYGVAFSELGAGYFEWMCSFVLLAIVSHSYGWKQRIGSVERRACQA